MLTVEQSPFLSSLGHALATSFWEMGVLWIVYTLLIRLVDFSARRRYQLAVATQLMGLTLFTNTLIINLLHRSSHNTANHFSLNTGLPVWVAKTEFVLPYLSLVYLPVLCWMSFRWIKAYQQAQMFRVRGLQKMPGQWRLFIQTHAARLGIRKEVRIFLSEKIATPITVGFLKPLILVPVASLNHLSTTQVEAVLLHELSHIKRYDYLVNIGLSLAELILFFNPFARMLSKTIQTEREHACDDQVLQFRYEPGQYAAALLTLATLKRTPVFALSASSGPRKQLLIRVQRITGAKSARKMNMPSFLYILAALGLATLLYPVSHPTQTKVSDKEFATIASSDRAMLSKSILASYIEPKKTIIALLHKATTHAAINNHPRKHAIVPVATVPDQLLPIEKKEITVATDAVPVFFSTDPAIDHGKALLAELKSIGLDQILDYTLSMQLTEDEKNELRSVKDWMITDRDKASLQKVLGVKQIPTDPVMINISFQLPMDNEDEIQLARIKFALLQRLNTIKHNRIKITDTVLINN